MPARKEDEIMAEYLLKGGKMLEKSCKTCGAPMFEVKGKTFCVVCAERKAEEKIPTEHAHENGSECTCSSHSEGEHECGGVMLADELAETILSLCERIQNEKDPDNVLALMNAVKAGTESLEILCKL
jgi:UPF0148 protein